MNARDEQIAELFNDGISINEIAAETRVTTRTVYRSLERTGKRIPIKRPIPTLTEQMTAMLQDGASYADVAETFDVGVVWLRNACPGYGWDGYISGTLARVLKRPEMREMYHAIQRMTIA